MAYSQEALLEAVRAFSESKWCILIEKEYDTPLVVRCPECGCLLEPTLNFSKGDNPDTLEWNCQGCSYDEFHMLPRWTVAILEES